MPVTSASRRPSSPLTPGAIAYRLRKTFEHGFRAAYYRDVVRPQILETSPVRLTPGGACEIHVLTSASDWLNLIWTLKSFYWVAGPNYGLIIHGDGTLSPEELALLRKHFPDARIISRPEADDAVLPELQAFPKCRHLRRTNTLALKLFDFRHYLGAERLMLLDSDILFFSRPSELLRRIDDPGYLLNSVNPDASTAYTVDPADVSGRFGFDLGPLFNSGLGLLHRASLRLDWLEEFLSLPGILGHPWRIEQTLFALSSFRYGAELLPDEYRVKLEAETAGCCKHYVGVIRHHMYANGMRRLARRGFLQEGC